MAVSCLLAHLHTRKYNRSHDSHVMKINKSTRGKYSFDYRFSEERCYCVSRAYEMCWASLAEMLKVAGNGLKHI